VSERANMAGRVGTVPPIGKSEFPALGPKSPLAKPFRVQEPWPSDAGACLNDQWSDARVMCGTSSVTQLAMRTKTAQVNDRQPETTLAANSDAAVFSKRGWDLR